MSNKAVIIDGVRSPIGTKGSPLIGMRPDEIAGQVIKGLLDRNKALNINDIEDVSLGCASLIDYSSICWVLSDKRAQASVFI